MTRANCIIINNIAAKCYTTSNKCLSPSLFDLFREKFLETKIMIVYVIWKVYTIENYANLIDNSRQFDSLQVSEAVLMCLLSVIIKFTCSCYNFLHLFHLFLQKIFAPNCNLKLYIEIISEQCRCWLVAGQKALTTIGYIRFLNFAH